MIVIEGYRFWSDWTAIEPKEVDESKIWGFELHYRGDDSWHVVVVTKERSHDSVYPYYTYEIWSGVPFSEMVKLLQNPIAKTMILRIVNYHSSTNFMEKLEKLITSTFRIESDEKNLNSEGSVKKWY